MSKDDRIPAVELTQWRVGQVLTEDDVQMLKRYLDQVDEEEEYLLENYSKAREHVIRELGGEELVEAFRLKDEQMHATAVSKAMKVFYEKQRAARAEAN